MNENQWRQLTAKAAQGDGHAFEALYKATDRQTYFLCLKLLADEQNAKDVVQETYLTAYNKLNTLDDGANFPKWINGIAVNLCKRFFRQTADVSLDEQLEQGEQLADDDSFLPEDYVTDDEKRRVIMNIIDTALSDDQRRTVILYYYDSMPTKEIARLMDCPEGTVTYRLSAARAKIKEAVLIYEEKHGERLHAAVPVPVLTRILRAEAERIIPPDISLLQKPAASKTPANNINAGGKAAMKTALKTKVIAAAAAVAVAGGGITAAVLMNNNDAETTPTVSTTTTAAETAADIITESIAEIAPDESPAAAAEDISSAAPADADSSDSSSKSGTGVNPHDHDGKYFNERDLYFYLPPNIKPGMGAFYDMWYNEIDKKYMWFDMNKLAFVPQDAYDPMDIEDLPEYFNEDRKFVQNLARPRRLGYAWYDLEVESEEKVEVFDGEYTFLKQVGTYYENDYFGEHTGEVMYFVAYFGTVDASGVESETYTLAPKTNVPIYWVAMTQEEDLRDYIEEVADESGRMAYRDENYNK